MPSTVAAHFDDKIIVEQAVANLFEVTRADHGQ